MNLVVKRFAELTTNELYEILKSRSEIFVMEQGILYQDMDDIDYDSLHCFFMEDNRVIAYLRAFYISDDKKIVKIGRVLTLKHGNGLGIELMKKSLAAIKTIMKPKKINIHAQKYAIGFYEKFGFIVTSDEFIEEEIVHVEMELEM